MKYFDKDEDKVSAKKVLDKVVEEHAHQDRTAA